MLAGPLPVNQYACRSFTTQSVCLLIFYHSFLHACWCCASLSAIPACMVYHYQPCLLMWSLTIGHAFWCDASLSAILSGVFLTIGHAFWYGPSLSTMPIGVVPHYRPCLLVSCHCNRHFYYLSAVRRMDTNMCYLYSGVITSGMFAELGPKFQCFLKVKDDLSEV